MNQFVAHIQTLVATIDIVSAVPTRLLLLAQGGGDDTDIGRWVFASVFLLLILVLLSLPAGRLWPEGEKPPWWRNARLWAVAVAATQMLVYIFWG